MSDRLPGVLLGDYVDMQLHGYAGMQIGGYAAWRHTAIRHVILRGTVTRQLVVGCFFHILFC